ncbi:hypothetical protein BT69DRAFT_1217671 [Atractiella rhizophila]|nr:hypothetical protein BT69DRAFT_1217671 [Atractiella rhizophila]
MPMQRVLPRVYIGDYQSSQDVTSLQTNKITHIVCAMRQSYEPPLPHVKVFQVPVDDTSRTNIFRWFDVTSEFIKSALEEGKERDGGEDGDRSDPAIGNRVLVHCQAGISRSTTLLAAFLMKELGINADSAVEYISRVRSIVQPSEFFLLQLEMYELCNCEVNPAKYPDYRRFLMNEMVSSRLSGGNPDSPLVLAYYPSPVSSLYPPSTSSSEGLSALSRPPVNAVNVPVPSVASVPMGPPKRERLTKKKETKLKPWQEERERQRREEEERLERERLEKEKEEKKKRESIAIGKEEKVVVTGRRIRCKRCRRELAARENVLVHEEGQGQDAFAPRRRDMNKWREEIERKKREDEKEKEKEMKRPIDMSTSPPLSLSAEMDRERSGSGSRSTTPIQQFIPPRPMVSRSNTEATTPPVDSPITPSEEFAPQAHKNGLNPHHLPSGLRVAMPAAFEDLQEQSEEEVVSTDVSMEKERREDEPPLLPTTKCTAYFVEPLSWMDPELKEGKMSGKLSCPNERCGAKLGNYDWAGIQCSCGSWVCPGFSISASKVDEILP